MASVKYEATFPERFAELIEGKTVVEAGEMLGISKTTVSAYTTGKRSPKVPVLKSIAHYFGVDPLWLMGMDVPKYKKTPEPEPESLSKDKAELVALVKDLSEDEIRAVRAIVDQVLSLRGK